MNNYLYPVLLLLLVVSAKVHAQNNDSRSVLISKLNYCSQEVEELEGKVQKYKQFLDLQTKEVQHLKQQLLEKEEEKTKVEIEKKELVEISLDILELAKKFERSGQPEAALEVYKLLIKVYPSSLEAASSRLKVDEINERNKMSSTGKKK